MSEGVLREILQKYFTNDVVEIFEIGGDGYYEVIIKSCVFEGKPLLERQKYFYALVWPEINNLVKAVSLKLEGRNNKDVTQNLQKKL